MTALAIQMNTDFEGVVKLMPVPIATVGSPEDYCQCDFNGTGVRPCEVCRVPYWQTPGVRDQVWPVVREEAAKARRIAFPHG